MRYGTRGAGDVPSYLLPGVPFLTSSIGAPLSDAEPYEVDFTNVTRFIVVRNSLLTSDTNVPLRVGFSSNGVKAAENNNYLVLNNGESFEGDLRVSKLYLRGESATLIASASVIAGITGIPGDQIHLNWSGSAGVG